MTNKSLITSFLSSPHSNKPNSVQTSIVTSPILLTQDSIESLEALSIQDHSPRDKGIVSSQSVAILDPDDSIILVSGDQSIENLNKDPSFLLLESSFVENTSENCEELGLDRNNDLEQPKTQVQTTISGIFKCPSDSNSLGENAERGKRERRKAAIKATKQMTDILTPSRSKPPLPPREQATCRGERSSKKSVASIFLSAAEKRKLKEQKLEEERLKEMEEKMEKEIENEKYESFFKFATETNPSSKPLPDFTQPDSQGQTLASLWSPLGHVRQLPAPYHTPTQLPPLPLLDISPASIDSVLEIESENYDFLKISSIIDECTSEQIKLDISGTDRDSRVSELVDTFPSLPVRELFSHYQSLTYDNPSQDVTPLCSSAESKKRTRQRESDTPITFRSKRRRNLSSSASSDESCITDCLIVDPYQSAPGTSRSLEALLWTEKYLPHETSLLLSDTAAVGEMKSFLKNWQKGCLDNNLVESSSESGSGTPKQSQNSDDEDFELFLKRQRVPNEDTCDSLVSSEDSLAGTMLLTGDAASGKTAAVYVIAREMGLKVLEINTSMNRSGRDLQLSLSEATQSFRVSGSKSKKSRAKLSDKANNFTKRDAGKMSSYSDGSLKSQRMSLDLKSQEDPKSVLTLTDDSLILLDEVDILFESDRGFWPAFQQIARETKLPIFLTSNETNDFEILPDIFTNHVPFPPNSLSKMSLFIHIILLVHDLDIPNQLAVSMASYFWPDLRRLTLLLQFWLTPRVRKNSNRKKKKSKGDIINFLTSFSFINTGILFNIYSLLRTHMPIRIHACEGTNEKSHTSTYKQLRRQYIARNIFSTLEIYQSRLVSPSPDSSYSSTRFGDGFSPDASLDIFSQFDQSLCGDIIHTASLCATKQSLVYSDILNKSYFDSLSSQELKIDEMKEWESSLVKVADSILVERGALSKRCFGEHYLPYLKMICASEAFRQMNNVRRHFKHYLTNSLTAIQIELLTNAELVH